MGASLLGVAKSIYYYFLLHEPLHGYFLYLVSAPPEKPTRRCEPEAICVVGSDSIIGVTL